MSLQKIVIHVHLLTSCKQFFEIPKIFFPLSLKGPGSKRRLPAPHTRESRPDYHGLCLLAQPRRPGSDTTSRPDRQRWWRFFWSKPYRKATAEGTEPDSSDRYRSWRICKDLVQPARHRRGTVRWRGRDRWRGRSRLIFRLLPVYIDRLCMLACNINNFVILWCPTETCTYIYC